MGKILCKKMHFFSYFLMFFAIFLLFFNHNFSMAETLEPQAFYPLCSRIDKIIQENPLSKNAIVSVKILDRQGSCLYNRQSSLLLKPASTLKIPVSALVLKVLGENYKIKTSLYSKGDVLFLGLSGDSTLKTEDLRQLFQGINLEKYSKIVIDRDFIDNSYWNNGWMWDNLISSDNVPFGVFNLDNNTIKLDVSINEGKILVTTDYPLDFVNELKIGSRNNIKIEKRPWQNFQNPDVVYVSGEITTPISVDIAINSPEKYFLYRLSQVLQGCEGYDGFSKKFYYGEHPKGAKLLRERQTPLLEVLQKINTDSHNLSAETIFKIVSRETFGVCGNFLDSERIFKNFYNREDYLLYDASGLSHKNLLTCDFLCDVLYDMKNNQNFVKTLATAGQSGTLKNRLEGVNLQAKTGTIDGVSGICGYLDNKYIFAILIQNYKGSSIPAKMLEDEIILELNK